MRKQQPIGIVDSGVGGLTVARVLLRRLPREKMVYLGDTANVPYGPKSVAELLQITKQNLSFLADQGVKLVIAACNTTSSVSLPILGSMYREIPVVGVVEPGARAAVRHTRNRRVGVIATEATVNSGAHLRQIQALDPAVQVFSQACPLFVPLVEKGQANSTQAREAARQYLRPLQEQGVDTLVLGCTHYPFLLGVLREVLGPGVSIVDPAEETINEVESLLERAGGLNDGPVREKGEHRYLATGPVESFSRVAGLMLEGFVPEVETVTV